MGRRFEGKVVWITGASSGIGEACARAFAAEGARLVLSARRRDELERVAAACGPSADVRIVPLDLAEVGHSDEAARAAVEAAGVVDVMVHNGGVSQRARAIDTSIDVDRRLFDVNYFGTIALTKALLPGMVSRRRGQFVVVTVSPAFSARRCVRRMRPRNTRSTDSSTRFAPSITTTASW